MTDLFFFFRAVFSIAVHGIQNVLFCLHCSAEIELLPKTPAVKRKRQKRKIGKVSGSATESQTESDNVENKESRTESDEEIKGRRAKR